MSAVWIAFIVAIIFVHAELDFFATINENSLTDNASNRLFYAQCQCFVDIKPCSNHESYDLITPPNKG